MTTVSNGEPTRKDTNMKLLYVISAILALTLAEEEKREVREVNNIEDSVAQASNTEILQEAASRRHKRPTQSHPTWPNQHPIQPIHTWVQPAQPVQPVQPGVQNGGNYWGGYTTPAPYKNEIHWGDHGDYSYEYKTPGGIHVGEQGWFTGSKQTDENLVKKGWYSYLGPDGKTYTVTYWADHTGYHAYGSHLPGANNYQTTTQRPTYTTTTYPVYPPYPPTYPIYQNQQPIYNQQQQQIWRPRYDV